MSEMHRICLVCGRAHEEKEECPKLKVLSEGYKKLTGKEPPPVSPNIVEVNLDDILARTLNQIDVLKPTFLNGLALNTATIYCQVSDCGGKAVLIGPDTYTCLEHAPLYQEVLLGLVEMRMGDIRGKIASGEFSVCPHGDLFIGAKDDGSILYGLMDELKELV